MCKHTLVSPREFVAELSRAWANGLPHGSGRDSETIQNVYTCGHEIITFKEFCIEYRRTETLCPPALVEGFE